MKSICFFNNKGGVGKTTLVCNIASWIAEQFQYRVLLVDADPQCNSTQLIVPSEELEVLYHPRKTKGNAARTGHSQTLIDVLQPIAQGDSSISATINPFPGNRSRFGIDLIPGHPKMATLEDLLSQSWISFAAADIGGSRKTNWNSQLTLAMSDQYDLVFFDVGPSLGALNRSVLVGVDYFMTPMGWDIFSLAGIDNISLWLQGWLGAYDRAYGECVEKWPDLVSEYVKPQSGGFAKFLGYTIQQHITKTSQLVGLVEEKRRFLGGTLRW